MGSRLDSHTKDRPTTGTVRLNKLKFLLGKDLVYGAYPCAHYEEKEIEIRKRYPDLLKTSKN